MFRLTRIFFLSLFFKLVIHFFVPIRFSPLAPDNPAAFVRDKSLSQFV
jgi:hypothetical protein